MVSYHQAEFSLLWHFYVHQPEDQMCWLVAVLARPFVCTEIWLACEVACLWPQSDSKTHFHFSVIALLGPIDNMEITWGDFVMKSPGEAENWLNNILVN